MSLRESLYRLRRVAESTGLHAETYVPDVRAVLDSDARLRAEVRELRRQVEQLKLAVAAGNDARAALAPKRKARR